MKLNYFPDTDSLYIDLSHKQSTDSQEVSKGVVLDYDAEGNLVGIDIDHASQKLLPPAPPKRQIGFHVHEGATRGYRVRRRK